MTSINDGRPHYAIVAGLFASMASLFGKFISYTDELIENETTKSYLSLPMDGQQEKMEKWILKLICIALMVACNVLVWIFFVKALHERGGSVIATVTSTATNYCCSAVIGSFVFGEKTTALWWFGTTLVILGLICISQDNDTSAKNQDDNSSKSDNKIDENITTHATEPKSR